MRIFRIYKHDSTNNVNIFFMGRYSMYTIKPSYNYFILKKIISGIIFILIFSIIIYFPYTPTLKFWLPIFSAIIYFFIVFIYSSLKFKNTFYYIKPASVLISCGVVFKCKIYIPFKNVNYIEKKQNILQKLSHSQTVVLYTTGGKTFIKNISLYAVKIIDIKLYGDNLYEE